MSNYSSQWPQVRPVFMQDYGNSPHIDPRATFSRSDTASSGDWNASTNSPGLVDGSGTANQYYRVSVAGTQDLGSGSITYAVGDYVKYSGSVWFKTTQPIGVTYWSNEKHLSSENLLFYSNPNNAAWTEQGSSITLNEAASPDGTTTASLLTEDSSTGAHRGYRSIAGNSVSGQAYTFVGYFKANGRTLVSAQFNGSGITTARVEFDLSSSGTATSRAGSPANSSISQIGSTGWYKCSFQATATGAATMYLNVYLQDGADSTSYTGDGTSGVYAWGFNVSTTGQLIHEDTTTQIHREYAPTLKYVTPATGGMARFEYDPSADGQSMGCLIEGQSTNLATYGSDLTNAAWNPLSAFIGGTAVGPDGTLSAVKLVASAGSSLYPRFRRLSFLTSTTQTFSIYVKPLEFQHLAISADGSASCLVQYNLSGSGAITSSTGATGTVEQCGNGWFRVSFSYTTVPNAHLAITMQSSTTYQAETGNGYDGMLFALAQLENQSFASSFIGTTSSTATRAAESLSVTDSSLFDNGSGALAAEYDMFAASETSYVLQTARSTGGTNNDGVTVYNSGLLVNGAGSNTRVGNTTSNVFHKVAASWQSGSQKISRDGGAVAEDTTTVVPQSGTDKLFIGVRQDGGEPVNGHIKRVAIYNEALSDTNLQALTS